MIIYSNIDNIWFELTTFTCVHKGAAIDTIRIIVVNMFVIFLSHVNNMLHVLTRDTNFKVDKYSKKVKVRLFTGSCNHYSLIYYKEKNNSSTPPEF